MNRFSHSNLLTVDGQGDLEAAPLARFAEYIDRPAVGLDNPARDRQPQPGAPRLVVKYGSKIRARFSGAIPIPLSLTLISILPCDAFASSISVPPSGIA